MYLLFRLRIDIDSFRSICILRERQSSWSYFSGRRIFKSDSRQCKIARVSWVGKIRQIVLQKKQQNKQLYFYCVNGFSQKKKKQFLHPFLVFFFFLRQRSARCPNNNHGVKLLLYPCRSHGWIFKVNIEPLLPRWLGELKHFRVKTLLFIRHTNGLLIRPRGGNNVRFWFIFIYFVYVPTYFISKLLTRVFWRD